MNRNTWMALSACALCTTSVLAQQTRPDSGTLLEPQRQIPTLPPPGGAPTVVVPPSAPAAAVNPSLRITPTAFRIVGSTLYTEAELLPLVNEYVGKPTDMEGLLKAAGAVRRYYRDRGYLLTEAYLPRQQFPAGSGPVVIQVLEARIGKVAVKVEGEGVSESLAARIVHNHLHAGDYISEYALDKPVLLLRDLVGFDATASVEPGANVGEADITVVVKPFGPRVDGSIGGDNYGIRSAGQYRIFANANLNNPTGNGDVLSARVQGSDRSGSDLYRVAYNIAVGGYATKLGVSATRTQYSLGKQFASLGASGDATVVGVSVTQPFIRSRSKNMLGAVTLERKDLTDDTESPASTSDKRVNAVRLSLLGNFVDQFWSGAFNSYAINLMHGDVKLGSIGQAIDQGPSGLDTAGGFNKLNIEYLRAMYFSSNARVTAGVQAQVASKNLTSAEKLALGGINGVRGYPVGEAVGDTGAIVNLEYQRQLPAMWGVPLTGSLFFDWGHIKFNQSGAPFSTQNNQNLSSAGFGLIAGTFGNYLVTTQLAWRTGSTQPASDPDKRPRVWFSLQKWL